MPDSPAFKWLSEQLDELIKLDALVVRGIVRLTLKQAGLDSASLTQHQTRTVVSELLPGMLERNGVEDPDPLVALLRERCQTLPAEDNEETAHATFKRLTSS